MAQLRLTLPRSPDASVVSCADDLKNGQETDVDCGGPACPKCVDGRKCMVGTDCQSGYCDQGSGGAPPPCANGVKDGQETDVDCGGGTCPKCPDGKKCGGNTDCVSGNCQAGSCQKNQAVPSDWPAVPLRRQPWATQRAAILALLAANPWQQPLNVFNQDGSAAFIPPVLHLCARAQSSYAPPVLLPNGNANVLYRRSFGDHQRRAAYVLGASQAQLIGWHDVSLRKADLLHVQKLVALVEATP
jgi:hypothetical protein